MKVNPSSLPDLPTGNATSIDYHDSLQQLSPAVSSISYILASNTLMANTLMELEMKKISIISLSSSLNNLFSGLYEIHIVSRVNIVCVGADLVRLAKSSFVTGISALFQTLLFGYINVNYDYLMLVRANVARTQVKSIYGFLFLEQASPFNISILRIIVLFLVFISLSSVPPVVIFLPLSMALSVVRAFTLPSSSSPNIYNFAIDINTSTTMNYQIESLDIIPPLHIISLYHFGQKTLKDFLKTSWEVF
ncbi:hypothetical protein YC2023_042901 [Brassica napus]